MQKVTRREAFAATGALGAAMMLPQESSAQRPGNADPGNRAVGPHPSFSATYQEARSKFLSAASGAAAITESHLLPAAVGYGGEPLAMDFAWLGPDDADCVVLSLSGTHGFEGFTGSAVQTDWLACNGKIRLPTGTAMLFVHAVNPFGFSHMLRCNENRVDLNRNFVDFASGLPANSLYDAIAPTLPSRVGIDEDLIAARAAAITHAEQKYGEWAVSDALSRGQYHDPAGPEYGGAEPQWSSTTLIEGLRRLCRRARHVAYIDWHTLVSIGDGRLVFLCFNQTGDKLYRRVGGWWTPAAIDRETVDRQWAGGFAKRRPSRNGLAMWGVQHALAPRCDVAGAVIEFCGDPDRFIHRADEERSDIYEQWLFANRDDVSPTREFVRAYLREIGSPTRRSYEDAAIAAASHAYEQVVEGAGRWAAENVPAEPGKLVRYSDFR